MLFEKSVNIFQKFLAIEGTIVISILLYTGGYIHALAHLCLTIYLINHLKKVNTDFTTKD